MKQLYENGYFLKLSTPHTPTVRVFCFHYAGGSASVFRNWVKDLPPHIEIIGVQLPGREGRFKEAPYTELSPIIDEITRDITPLLDKPFIFFGHSLGGLVSFELARKLQEHHKAAPSHLIISGGQAPQLPLRRKKIHNLADEELLRELASFKGASESLLTNKELMKIFIPVIRADFTISEQYVYEEGPLLSCPITVLCGLEDPYVFLEDLEGWRQHTSGDYLQYLFEGDHFFAFKDAYTQVTTLLSKFILETT